MDKKKDLLSNIRLALLSKNYREFRNIFEDLVKNEIDNSELKHQFDQNNFPEIVPLRLGIHYISAYLGRWFRGVWTNKKERPNNGPYHDPFGRTSAPRTIESLWEKEYDLVPKGMNYLVDECFEESYFIQFRRDSKIDNIDNKEFSVGIKEWNELFKFLQDNDLFKEIYKKFRTDEIVEEPTRTLSQFTRRLINWLNNQRPERPLSKDPEGLFSALYSFLFTWYSTITALPNPENIPEDYSWLAIVCPYPQYVDLPQRYAALGGIFEVKKERIEEVVDIKSFLIGIFEEILERIRGIETDVFSEKPAPENLALEKAIRAFHFVTPREIYEWDQWHDWRKYIPPEAKIEDKHKNDEVEARAIHWKTPLWGMSRKMEEIFSSLQSLLEVKNGEDKPKVESIFLYSEPGCGKEMIGKLCHYMSHRSHDFEAFYNAFINMQNSLKDVLGRKANRIIQKTLSDCDVFTKKIILSKSIKRQFRSALSNKECLDGRFRWDFNYFTENCYYLTKVDVVPFLFGNFTKDNENLGLLNRASLLNGTIYFDEFHKLREEDSSLFLRITEKPYELVLPESAYKIPLRLLLIFASNETPAQLKDKGWNPALLGRIAKPGRYFEIPSLSQRKEDIALLTAYYLQRCAEKNKIDIGLIDLNALRLICELPWMGNYRELISFLDNIIVSLPKQLLPEDVGFEIGFEEVMNAIKKMNLIPA